MSALIQAAVLFGIGTAAAAIIYNYYLRDSSANAKVLQEEAIAVETPIASAQAILEKIKPAITARNEKPKAKSSTPIKAICGSCKKAAMLPFRCKFCALLFCGEHRLPENHSCEAL